MAKGYDPYKVNRPVNEQKQLQPYNAGAQSAVSGAQSGFQRAAQAAAKAQAGIQKSSVAGTAMLPGTVQAPVRATAGGGGGGASPYAAQLNALYDQIVNRKPFRFDLANDPLYRQAAEQYTLTGRQAMADTMGRAAALTGGYGNSFAQAAGNQQYQQYLTQLNAMTPEIWDRQYQAYLNQGDKLLQDYKLAQAHAAASGRGTGAAMAVAEPTEDATQGAEGSNWSSWLMNMLAQEQAVNAVARQAPNVQTLMAAKDPFADYFDKLKKEQEKNK